MLVLADSIIEVNGTDNTSSHLQYLLHCTTLETLDVSGIQCEDVLKQMFQQLAHLRELAVEEIQLSESFLLQLVEDTPPLLTLLSCSEASNTVKERFLEKGVTVQVSIGYN